MKMEEKRSESKDSLKDETTEIKIDKNEDEEEEEEEEDDNAIFMELLSSRSGTNSSSAVPDQRDESTSTNFDLRERERRSAATFTSQYDGLKGSVVCKFENFLTKMRIVCSSCERRRCSRSIIAG